MAPSLVAAIAAKKLVTLRFSEPISSAGGGPLSPLYLTIKVNGFLADIASFTIDPLNASELQLLLPDQMLETATSIIVKYEPPTDTSDQGFIVNKIGERFAAYEGSVNTLLTAARATTSLAAGFENLILTGSSPINALGNTQNNTITGNSASNKLDGNTGADRLIGGDGNDTYILDNVGDTVEELPNQGADSVYSSVSYQLPANVEHLFLTGSGPISGTGNGAANTITGNMSANVLDGGGGRDWLIGGWGNDTYIVDSSEVGIVEAGPISDVDLVVSSISWVLGDKLEKLTLVGGANINGTGNKLDNLIVGNDRNNVLDGGIGGVDVLTGMGGADIFRLSARPSSFSASTADRISDFSPSEGDKLQILKNIYRIKSANVSLTIAQTTSNVDAALRGSALFVYNLSSGELIWNENGTTRGFGRGGIIAVFDNKTSLSSTDLVLI